MQRNHGSWRQFAYELNYSLLPEEIVLVSGFLKTSDFAIVSYAKDTHDPAATLDFYSSTHRFELSRGSLWTQQNAPFDERPLQGTAPESQTGYSLFVKYYRISGTNFKTSKGLVSIHGDSNAESEPTYRKWLPSFVSNVIQHCVIIRQSTRPLDFVILYDDAPHGGGVSHSSSILRRA